MDTELTETTVVTSDGWLHLSDPCYVLTPDGSDRPDSLAKWIANAEATATTANGIQVGNPIARTSKHIGMALKVAPGEYPVTVRREDEGEWGVRVAALTIHLTPRRDLDNLNRVNVGSLFVDAGLMWMSHPATLWRDSDPRTVSWSAFCDHTFTYTREDRTDFWAPLDAGLAAMSSTGYGDGQYNVNIVTEHSGLAVAIEIVFIEQGCEDCGDIDCNGDC